MRRPHQLCAQEAVSSDLVLIYQTVNIDMFSTSCFLLRFSHGLKTEMRGSPILS